MLGYSASLSSVFALSVFLRGKKRLKLGMNSHVKSKFYFLISNVVTLNGGRRSETKSEPSVAVLADCGL